MAGALSIIRSSLDIRALCSFALRARSASFSFYSRSNCCLRSSAFRFCSCSYSFRWGGIGGLFCGCSWIVYRAVVVRAYGEGGSYALAVDDDCGLSRCTRRGWLGVRGLGLHLAERPALGGSGPPLSLGSPAGLRTDTLATGCQL